MAAIEHILLAEIKEFYPVTDSLSQDRIDTVMKHIKNVTFLQMFGFSISAQIFAGAIADLANVDFMGFKRFIALCIAGHFCEETYIHTNAGLKAINQPNWGSPTAATKNTTLLKINNAIEAQFLEAKKVLKVLEQTPANNFEAYSSFQIDKI